MRGIKIHTLVPPAPERSELGHHGRGAEVLLN